MELKPIEHAAFRVVASKHARDGDSMRNIETKAATLAPLFSRRAKGKAKSGQK
jgi:hypothetical protein